MRPTHTDTRVRDEPTVKRPANEGSPNGPSIVVVRPSGKAVRPLMVSGRGPVDNAGSGKLLPSQTGKPWPGGGTVPPPDEGNQDAKRV